MRANPILIVFGFIVLAFSSQAFAAEPFDGAEQMPLLSVSSYNLDNIPQWNRILQSYATDMPDFMACAEKGSGCGWDEVRSWQNFVYAMQGESPEEQMRQVNYWLNKFTYRYDKIVYGRSDHWASLREFLQNSGDCEDFAIAKYITLRQLGFRPDQLKVAIVYDKESQRDHAYLSVMLDGEIYVLDNRDDSPVPIGEIDRYDPHFLFNENDLWVFNAPALIETAKQQKSFLVSPADK